MKKQKTQAPRIIRWIFTYFIDPVEHDSLHGDFDELYRIHREEQGRVKAVSWYIVQILKTFPVFFYYTTYWGLSMFKNYIKTALRNIRKYKVYSFINISGLSIGMACCILILLWIRYEWSYDRFHKNTDTIHRIVVNWPSGTHTSWTWRTPPPLAAALKTDLPGIEEASRFHRISGILVEKEQTGFNETIGFTDPELFSIFTLPLQSGNPETVLADPHSIVISETTARKYFGREDPLGKVMIVGDSLSLQISAVMEDIPPNSVISCPILIPFRHMETLTGYGNVDEWGDFGYNTYVLLTDHADPNDTNHKLKDYLDIRWEEPENEVELTLQPLTRIHLYDLGGGGPIVYIWIFSAIAVFILLIACINFMNLTTARSATRAREIGVRKVVGANRRQLIRQFLFESFLLSLISLLAAFVIVILMIKPMTQLAGLPAKSHLFDPGVIPLFLLITVLTGLIAGSYPAFLLSSIRSAEILKSRQKYGSLLFRKCLTIFQFTISIFLLISLLLISRQLGYMNRKPLGFVKNHIIYVPLNDDLLRLYGPFRQELLRNPDISHMTATSSYVGLGPMWSTSGVDWEGRTPDASFSLDMIYADQDFAETFQLGLAAGRYFSREYTTDATNFILNEAAIAEMGLENPVGMEIGVTGQRGRIIGVLNDFNFEPLRNHVQPLVILMQPRYFRYTAIKIEAENIPSTLAFIEQTFQRFSPRYPFEYRFLDEVIDQTYHPEQRSRQLLRYFVLLAGFISCLGLFGLASFMVQKRTKEIGIRKTLGASTATIFLLLSKGFIRWVIIANFIAWPIAYFTMNKWLQSFAYHINLAPELFLFSGMIAFSAALMTVGYQAIRAAQANPVDSLKYE
jgi:putative ABC transport system permease protein